MWSFTQPPNTLMGKGRILGGALVGRDELMEKAFGVVRTGGISLSPLMLGYS